MNYTDEELLHFKLLGKRIGGTLNAWQEHDKVFAGYIKDDEYWIDGDLVTTSKIQSVDPELRFVVTRNTVYSLGKPRSKYSDHELAVLAQRNREINR